MGQLSVSERFACRVLGQPWATQRKEPQTGDDEVAPTADIIALARQYSMTLARPSGACSTLPAHGHGSTCCLLLTGTTAVSEYLADFTP